MNLAEQRMLAELYRPWKGIDTCDCPAQLHKWHDEGMWRLVLSHPAYLRHVQHRADALGVSEVAGLVAALPVLRLGDDVPQDVRLCVAGPVMARIEHLLDNPGDNADLVRARSTGRGAVSAAIRVADGRPAGPSATAARPGAACGWMARADTAEVAT